MGKSSLSAVLRACLLQADEDAPIAAKCCLGEVKLSSSHVRFTNSARSGPSDMKVRGAAAPPDVPP